MPRITWPKLGTTTSRPSDGGFCRCARAKAGRPPEHGNTFGTALVRDGHDLVLVAELMGHARVETTRGAYSLPTAQDHQRATNSPPPTDR
jgi:integrase